MKYTSQWRIEQRLDDGISTGQGNRAAFANLPILIALSSHLMAATTTVVLSGAATLLPSSTYLALAAA